MSFHPVYEGNNFYHRLEQYVQKGGCNHGRREQEKKNLYRG